MSGVTTVTVITNTDPDSCVDVRCDCETMWSLAQQFCYMRLSNKTGKSYPYGHTYRHVYRLVDHYPVRARRIAATYARIYLEQEERSDPTKKGRHYWMALGAFASKTVACTLEDRRLLNHMSQTVRDGLGKGNLWLFMDIAAWHWHYNLSPGSFALCVNERDTATYVSAFKAQMDKLPWAAESLGKIKNFQATAEVVKAMGYAKKLESTSGKDERRDLQFKNLMAWAVHEQKNILQKLIYDDRDFAWWVQVQRGGKDAGTWGRMVGLATSWMAPRLKIAFVSACDTDLPEFVNMAPEDTKLEQYESRMKWIGRVAAHFHRLMGEQPQHMEQELGTIAGWVEQADFIRYPNEVTAS